MRGRPPEQGFAAPCVPPNVTPPGGRKSVHRGRSKRINSNETIQNRNLNIFPMTISILGQNLSFILPIFSSAFMVDAQALDLNSQRSVDHLMQLQDCYQWPDKPADTGLFVLGDPSWDSSQSLRLVLISSSMKGLIYICINFGLIVKRKMHRSQILGPRIDHFIWKSFALDPLASSSWFFREE